jgi:hypothetical protein
MTAPEQDSGRRMTSFRGWIFDPEHLGRVIQFLSVIFTDTDFKADEFIQTLEFTGLACILLLNKKTIAWDQ